MVQQTLTQPCLDIGGNMADLQRGMNEIILRDDKLKKKHLEIIISEKINQVKQMEVTLERMKTVDMQKVELAIASTHKEIEEFKIELSQLNGKIIDVK